MKKPAAFLTVLALSAAALPVPALAAATIPAASAANTSVADIAKALRGKWYFTRSLTGSETDKEVLGEYYVDFSSGNSFTFFYADSTVYKGTYTTENQPDASAYYLPGGDEIKTDGLYQIHAVSNSGDFDADFSYLSTGQLIFGGSDTGIGTPQEASGVHNITLYRNSKAGTGNVAAGKLPAPAGLKAAE
ncbi:MAG: hypothetical protein LBU36_06700 [Clostridiales bacterium]|jgi:hypothetical protein|nr:hypothetical protein [Clostridiales bacterium]